MGAALIHALATAVAIDVRIMAVILPIGTALLLALRLMRTEVPSRTALTTLAVYAVATCVLVVLMWPWLWADPWNNFHKAFSNMAHFRWDLPMRYMGSEVYAFQLPWHYAPVWIAISTPPLYLIMFVCGALSSMHQILNSKFKLWQNDSELQDLIFLTLFMVPLLSVIALHSVLYDGWRQLYFLYPPFLLVALRGWKFCMCWASKASLAKAALIVVLLFSLAHTGEWMIRAHPLQNLYFNMFAGKNWKAHFELDYWGLSNRQALEYILKNENNSDIAIWPCSFNYLSEAPYMLKPEDRVRIRVVKEESEADFVLNNFRGDLASCPDQAADFGSASSKYRPYFQIKIGDEVISSIVKRTNSNEKLEISGGGSSYRSPHAKPLQELELGEP